MRIQDQLNLMRMIAGNLVDDDRLKTYDATGKMPNPDGYIEDALTLAQQFLALDEILRSLGLYEEL